MANDLDQKSASSSTRAPKQVQTRVAVQPKTIGGYRSLKAYVSFYKNPIPIMGKLHRKYGDVLRIDSPFRPEANPPSFLLTGEIWNKAVLTNQQAFRPGGIWPVAGPPGSALQELRKNYLVLYGAPHTHFSKVASPAFNRSRVNLQYKSLTSVAVGEIDNWPLDAVVDCERLSRRLMQKLAFRGLFGEADPENVGALGDAVEDFHLRQWRRGNQLLPIDCPYSPYRTLLEKADDLRTKLLKWTDMPSGSEDRADLRACFRTAVLPDGNAITDDEKAAHMAGLILASYETASATLSWALMLLALHPDFFKKLRDEADRSGIDTDLTGTDRDRPLLNGFINETLRLFPPVPFLGFRALYDTDLQSLPVRKNSLVFLSVLLTQRDPAVFIDPWEFMPERWQEISPNTYQFPAFSGGARRCPGFWFATIMLRYALSYIVSSLDIRVPEKAAFNYRYAAVMRPRGGIPLVLFRRGIGTDRMARRKHGIGTSARPVLRGNVNLLFRHGE